MSARSPRGSLSGAAEVATDFNESLKDLQMNNKYEISNLTLIAKENTEHAQAISKTLEEHIKTTAPLRKLPALYVLDSVVKNVGTPYTVYLGRNLYQTFMDAYTLVDGNTRRNMEGMLKTWKEPVPGALESTPVFPPEIVRPIENALIKFRTVMVQNNRQVQVQQQTYRNTPTPPQHNGRYGVPPSQGQGQSYYAYGVQQPSVYQQNTFSPAPNYQQQHGFAAPEARPVNDVEAIKRDVAAVITQRQAQFAADPFHTQTQQELNALLQLQKLLNTQVLDAGALQQIRNQISALAAAAPPAQSTPQPAPAQHQWQPPSSMPPLSHLARPPLAYSQPQPPSTQPQLPSVPFLDPSALSGLQALLANGQKPSTPQMRAAAPALQNASHSQLSNVQIQAAAAPSLNGVDLIASLAKNGLLPNLPPPNPTPNPSTTASPQPTTADLLKSLSTHGLFPPSYHGTPTLSTALPATSSTSRPRIPMTASSLKNFRPELVYALYDANPNQCSTCGRRFPATDAGRASKARHLDWHFRTNQRMADASIARGAHRHWFSPELEWVQLVEFDPSTTSAEAAAAAESGAGTKAGGKAKEKRPEEKFVRAPPGVTRNVCSIDFEEMQSTYSEELQDWVFTNAVVWGGKIVHATCAAEMAASQSASQASRGGLLGGGGAGGGAMAAALQGQQRQRSATPDSTSSLGKRKAEGALAGVGARMRME